MKSTILFLLLLPVILLSNLMAQSLQVSFDSDTVWGCVNESLILSPMVDGGITPYQYAWSDGSTSDSLLVNPDTVGEWIYLEVVDGNSDTANDSVWVTSST